MPIPQDNVSLFPLSPSGLGKLHPELAAASAGNLVGFKVAWQLVSTVPHLVTLTLGSIIAAFMVSRKMQLAMGILLRWALETDTGPPA